MLALQVDGVRIAKPLLEEPASGEDHNFGVYYPLSMVGVQLVKLGQDQGCGRWTAFWTQQNDAKCACCA